MPITPAPSTFYNLQIKPDYIADTVAEIDAALATYEGQYVLAVDTNKIYYVERAGGDLARIEAYDFTNYRHNPDGGGAGTSTSILFGAAEPSNLVGVDGDSYLKIHENRWYQKAGGIWVDQTSIILAVQPTFPTLTSGQRGVLMRTLEFSDPTIITPYISGGDGSDYPGTSTSITGTGIYYPTSGPVFTKGTAVKVNSLGQLEDASYDDVTLDNVLGITTGSTTGSGMYEVLLYGIMRENTWTWTIGGAIYVGLNGAITQTAPTTGILVELGFAIETTALNIRIQKPIYL